MCIRISRTRVLSNRLAPWLASRMPKPKSQRQPGTDPTNKHCAQDGETNRPIHPRTTDLPLNPSRCEKKERKNPPLPTEKVQSIEERRGKGGSERENGALALTSERANYNREIPEWPQGHGRYKRRDTHTCIRGRARARAQRPAIARIGYA